MSEQPEPLSEARLAESPSERIVRQWRVGPLEAMPTHILLETAQKLQADNVRLRAALEVVRAVAEARVVQTHPHFGEMTIRIAGDGHLIERARALLADGAPSGRGEGLGR